MVVVWWGCQGEIPHPISTGSFMGKATSRSSATRIRSLRGGQKHNHTLARASLPSATRIRSQGGGRKRSQGAWVRADAKSMGARTCDGRRHSHTLAHPPHAHLLPRCAQALSFARPPPHGSAACTTIAL